MTVPEILETLDAFTGRHPTEAMRAAIDQCEAITPQLLRTLEVIAEDPEAAAKKKDAMLPVLALFLLAQFREKRAYPLIVKILSAPGEVPFDLFGDTVTEGLCQILASVYDGDPAPLQGLIESEEVDEFVRSAALRTFLVMEHTGLMPRTGVIEYFRSLFQGKLQRTPSYAWDALVSAVADLPAPELINEMRQAFQDDLTDPMCASCEELEGEIAAPPEWAHDGQYLITDAISETSWWACFDSDTEAPEEAIDETVEPWPGPPEQLAAPEPPVEYVAPKPFIRQPKIGRNELCPCGSGKKYKKCCGKS